LKIEEADCSLDKCTSISLKNTKKGRMARTLKKKRKRIQWTWVESSERLGSKVSCRWG